MLIHEDNLKNKDVLLFSLYTCYVLFFNNLSEEILYDHLIDVHNVCQKRYSPVVRALLMVDLLVNWADDCFSQVIRYLSYWSFNVEDGSRPSNDIFPSRFVNFFWWLAVSHFSQSLTTVVMVSSSSISARDCPCGWSALTVPSSRYIRQFLKVFSLPDIYLIWLDKQCAILSLIAVRCRSLPKCRWGSLCHR